MHDIDVVGDLRLCKVCCIWLVLHSALDKAQLLNLNMYEMLPSYTSFQLLARGLCFDMEGSVNI